MNRDKLFLLKRDFLDKGEKYYCPECAQLEGVLSFFAELRKQIDVQYVDFQRPRPDVVREVGEANQSCPVLVLGVVDSGHISGINARDFNGKKFISGAEDIGNYFAKRYGISRPH